MKNCTVCGAEIAPQAVVCWACGATPDAAPAASTAPTGAGANAAPPPGWDAAEPVAAPPPPTAGLPDSPPAPTPPAAAPAAAVSPPVAAPPMEPAAGPAVAKPAAAKRSGFQPVWLFGIAAVLAGCAAVLWVVLQHGSGDGDEAKHPGGGARTGLENPGPDRDAPGPWGQPWGGDKPGAVTAGDARIDPEALPWKGSDRPLVALIEFGDYECEFTKRAQATVERVLARFQDDVRLIFVHNPLKIHDHAVLAAEAAEAARLQGKFGEMHQRLLDAGGAVDREAAIRLARELGLDAGRFERDLDGAAKQAVSRMIAFAKLHRLDATPHFVVGSEIVAGAKSEDEFVRAIEAALQAARAQVDSGKSRSEVYETSLGPLSEAAS